MAVRAHGYGTGTFPRHAQRTKQVHGLAGCYLEQGIGIEDDAVCPGCSGTAQGKIPANVKQRISCPSVTQIDGAVICPPLDYAESVRTSGHGNPTNGKRIKGSLKLLAGARQAALVKNHGIGSRARPDGRPVRYGRIPVVGSMNIGILPQPRIFSSACIRNGDDSHACKQGGQQSRGKMQLHSFFLEKMRVKIPPEPAREAFYDY